MEMVVVGIDVSKAGLDVHVLPAGEAFAVGRDAAGIDGLIERPLAPAMVAVEATGGLESVVAAGLGAAGLPVVVVNPAQVRAFAQAHDGGIGASGRRPIPSTRRSSPSSPWPPSRRSGLWPMPRPRLWRI